MVFSCVSCQTKYRIDDQLVVGRTIKFHCRKCGQAHLIRDPGEFDEYVVATGPTPATSQTQASTRDTAPPAETTPAATPAAPTPGGWLVMIGGRRAGPMTADEIRTRFNAGQIDARTLAWRPSMPQWQRLRDLDLGFDLSPRTTASEPAPASPPPLPGAGPTKLADRLYDDLSTPAIDLRRAAEVQPDEPIWHSRVGRRPASTEDTPATQPSGVILSPEWPSQVSEESGPSDIPNDPSVIRPPPPVPPSNDGVHDFGDLINGIQRRERRRQTLRIVAVVIAVLVAIGGLAGAAAFWHFRDDNPAASWLGQDDDPAASLPGATEQLAPGVDEPMAPSGPVVRPPSSSPAPQATTAVAVQPESAAAIDAQMDTFLKRQQPDFLACRSHLKSPTDATVNVRLDFTVDLSGAVDGISVEAMDGIQVMPLIECVRAMVEKWHFDPRSERRSYNRVLGL